MSSVTGDFRLICLHFRVTSLKSDLKKKKKKKKKKSTILKFNVYYVNQGIGSVTKQVEFFDENKTLCIFVQNHFSEKKELRNFTSLLGRVSNSK